MNYRNRRNLKGLSIYTIAKELGVDYNQYLEVEKGKRHLEQEYIDKFLKILTNAKEIKLNRMAKLQKIYPLFTSGEMKNKCREYGYSHKQLGKALGLTQGAISNAMTGNKKMTSDDTMERIYDFLTNPFNKKVKEVVETKLSRPYTSKSLSTPQVEKLFSEHSITDIYTAMGFNRNSFAKWLGISEQHLNNCVNGRRRLSAKLKEKTYNTYQELIANGSITKEEPTEEYNENIELEELKNNDMCIEEKVVEEQLKEEPTEKSTDLEKLLECVILENERLKKYLDAFAKLVEKI
jgi:transcriptional regulator with XRE-family HTH domain